MLDLPSTTRIERFGDWNVRSAWPKGPGVSPTGERRRQERRRRRGLASKAKQTLRDLRIELGVLGHQVCLRAELRDIDLAALDVIVRHGPLGPSALARRIGVHAATMTGVLTRLEDAGWIVRERAADDRRAVVLRSAPERQRELLRLWGGMNTDLDAILEDYSEDQLRTIIDFLQRATDAGRENAERLA